MDDPAFVAGQLIGMLLTFAVPVVLLVVGYRRRRASNGTKGLGFVVAGWVVLGLLVLSTLARLGQAGQGA